MIAKFLNSDVFWLESVDSTNEEIKRRVTETGKSQKLLSGINDSIDDLHKFEEEYH